MTVVAEEAVRKAEGVALAPDQPSSSAFVAITRECIVHWQLNEADLFEHSSVAGLHQTRVGLRRLRSAFSLFRPWLGEIPGYAALTARIRGHILPLGPARDLDVLLGGDLAQELTLSQRARLREARDAAYHIVRSDLAGEDWVRIKLDLGMFLGRAPWGLADDPPIAAVAPLALERRWDRIAIRGRMLAALSPEQRHQVRIEAKKLRYGAQFFAALFPDGPQDGVGPLAYADLVAQLQDDLGRLNDLAVAGDLLRSIDAPPPSVDVEAEIAVAQQSWARLMEHHPFWR